ncbi:MAG: hypothetical protein WEB62_01440, partial [Bacteroidota bacterium]
FGWDDNDVRWKDFIPSGFNSLSARSPKGWNDTFLGKYSAISCRSFSSNKANNFPLGQIEYYPPLQFGWDDNDVRWKDFIPSGFNSLSARSPKGWNDSNKAIK